jgi:hypothetical protein
MKIQKVFQIGLFLSISILAISLSYCVLTLSLGGEFLIKMIFTAISLGVYSFTGYKCSLCLEDLKLRPLGLVGIYISIPAAVVAILTNWQVIPLDGNVALIRFFFFVIAIQICEALRLLKIAISVPLGITVRKITIFAIAIMTALIFLGIFASNTLEVSWRLIIIAGIFQTFGSIVLRYGNWIEKSENNP